VNALTVTDLLALTELASELIIAGLLIALAVWLMVTDG
jgi:hypothetical protein